MSDFDFSRATNIGRNAILPLNPLQGMLAVGSLEYVAIEVFVSKLLRILLRMDTKGLIELATVHAVSLAFMGGAAGFMDPPSSIASAKLLTQLRDGAKGIPAVLLAMWSVDTLSFGFHAPFTKWTLKDVLVSAASKALSRPIFSLMYPLLPQPMKDPFNLTEMMVNRQTNSSTLRRAAGYVAPGSGPGHAAFLRNVRGV